MKKFFLLLACVPLLGAGSLEWDLPMGSELRQEIPDARQAALTTSVNWIDFKPELRKGQRALRVVIDAGHGGKDEGAIGHGGLFEKDVCLRVAHLVRADLERRSLWHEFPVEVYLTREFDEFVSLSDRVKQASDWEADLFISLHANSSESPKPKGFEVYFLSSDASDKAARQLARAENASEPLAVSSPVLSILNDARLSLHVQDSSRLAERLYQALAVRFRPNGRGVRQGPFRVLAGTEMPAVLVEMAFLSNRDDSKQLSRRPFLKSLSSAISAGILDFGTQLRKFSPWLTRAPTVGNPINSAP